MVFSLKGLVRDLLITILLFSVVAAMAEALGTVSPRPNFLIIITDDQAYTTARFGKNDYGEGYHVQNNSVHHLIHQVPRPHLDKYDVKEIPGYGPGTMGKYEDWFKRFITLGEITDMEMRRYYLAPLNCPDYIIGRVLDALEDLSVADNTLVVFFSDNGGSHANGWERQFSTVSAQRGKQFFYHQQEC